MFYASCKNVIVLLLARESWSKPLNTLPFGQVRFVHPLSFIMSKFQSNGNVNNMPDDKKLCSILTESHLYASVIDTCTFFLPLTIKEVSSKFRKLERSRFIFNFPKYPPRENQGQHFIDKGTKQEKTTGGGGRGRQVTPNSAQLQWNWNRLSYLLSFSSNHLDFTGCPSSHSSESC